MLIEDLYLTSHCHSRTSENDNFAVFFLLLNNFLANVQFIFFYIRGHSTNTWRPLRAFSHELWCMLLCNYYRPCMNATNVLVYMSLNKRLLHINQAACFMFYKKKSLSDFSMRTGKSFPHYYQPHPLFISCDFCENQFDYLIQIINSMVLLFVSCLIKCLTRKKIK